MNESSWVRSVYLYLMCVVSVALVGLGGVAAAVGVVHTAAPDLGHRDTLDRVGIGLSNIGSSVVDLFDDSGAIEGYCRDVTDNDDDFDDCVEEELRFSGASEMASIQEGIGEVRGELQSQIRNNSISHVVRGLLMIAAGVVIFRIHGPRTEVFANGLFPRRPEAAPALTPPAATTTAPLPPAATTTAPLPPAPATPPPPPGAVGGPPPA